MNVQCLCWGGSSGTPLLQLQMVDQSSPQPLGPGTVSTFAYVGEVGRNNSPSFRMSVNVRGNTPEKGRAVMFLRAFLLESELHLVHLRGSGGGWYRDLLSMWYKSKHLSSSAINQICWHVPLQDYLCGQEPVWSRSSAHLIPLRPRMREQELPCGFFSRLFHGARTWSAIVFADFPQPELHYLTFGWLLSYPWQLHIMCFKGGLTFGGARGRLLFHTARYQYSWTIPFYALQCSLDPDCVGVVCQTLHWHKISQHSWLQEGTCRAGESLSDNIQNHALILWEFMCDDAQPQKWLLGGTVFTNHCNLEQSCIKKFSLGITKHKGGSKPPLFPGTSSGKHCSSLKLGCVLGISHSSIPVPGHMGTFDLLSSFCGAFRPVQGTHFAQKCRKFQKFCILSWWILL